MKLSIVTPSFQQAKYLEQTITSVLSSQRLPDEYFVIDGGSTDGSLEIIQRYAERLTGWVSEKDRGQANAINKGFAMCSGDVLGWLNSDDTIEPEAYTQILQAFERDPDLAIVYGNVNSIDAEGTIFNRQTFKQFSITDLACFNIISQPAVFFRRSAWEAAGQLDESYHYLLDHHLWLRLATQGKTLYLPKVLANARYHADAKNIAAAAKFGEEAFRIAEWMSTYPALQAIYQQNKYSILSGANSIDAFYQVEAGNQMKALAAMFRAARYDVKSVKRNYKRAILSLLNIFGLGKARKFYDQVRKKDLNG